MKPKIIKDYDKLTEEIQEQIKLFYPYGFSDKLITFKNAKNAFVSALPFETEDRYYLVRMTQKEAKDIVKEDSDYNDDGILKADIMEEYDGKYDKDEELSSSEDEDE